MASSPSRSPKSSEKNKRKRSNSPYQKRSRSRDSRPKRRSSEPRQQESSPFRGRRDPEKISKNAKLFITNIDSKYTSEQVKRDLEQTFSAFGKIRETVVKTKQGSSNSFAFIEFETINDAVKAQEEMRGKDFKGKELKVEFGRGERKQEERKSDKCYICHKEGHFAKECRSGRYDQPRRERRRYDSLSRSNSSSRSHRRRRHRDSSREEYRRRDSRRSRTPERKGSYRRN